MAMTKKHFEAIATAIRDARCNMTTMQEAAIDVVAERIADTIADEYPRFNRHRFLEACGVDGEVPQ